MGGSKRAVFACKIKCLDQPGRIEIKYQSKTNFKEYRKRKFLFLMRQVR